MRKHHTLFRSLLLLAALLASLLLPACGHTHVWTEATCTQPKTCAECGETEGEPLGHDMLPATCEEPSTCSRCGATEGKALGHTWEAANCEHPKLCSVCGKTEGEPSHVWKEANYQEPKTCTLCGTTDGEPLTPDVVKHKLEDHLIGLGETVELGLNDGKFTVKEYERFERDNRHPAVEGYEWLRVVFDLTTSYQKNTDRYVCGVSYTDYYDIWSQDTTWSENNTESWMPCKQTFRVEWFGEEFLCGVEYISSSFTNSRHYATLYFCVPKGYDGMIVYAYAHSPRATSIEHLYDIADRCATPIFRLD